MSDFRIFGTHVIKFFQLNNSYLMEVDLVLPKLSRKLSRYTSADVLRLWRILSTATILSLSMSRAKVDSMTTFERPFGVVHFISDVLWDFDFALR